MSTQFFATTHSVHFVSNSHLQDDPDLVGLQSHNTSRREASHTQTIALIPIVCHAQVVLLPDNVDAIASEVRTLSESVELVITSGGMGPTLDDVTMEGVAKALGKALVRCGT